MPWTFITSHASVLVRIAASGQITVRELALELGLTQRSVARVIRDLESEGYIERKTVGRVNWYRVHPQLPMRRRELRHIPSRALLELLAGEILADERSAVGMEGDQTTEEAVQPKPVT